MEAVNNKRDQVESSSYTTKKKSLSYNSLKRNRAFRSEKKSQEKDGKPSFKRQQMRSQLQTFIALIPPDEGLIEDYIYELKRKLEVVKSTKNMKVALPHDQQHLKFRQKIKKEDQSPLHNQKKNENKWKLFQEIRSNAKRQKLRSPDYRTPYHNINNQKMDKSSTFKRFEPRIQPKSIRFQPKSIRLTQMQQQIFPRTKSDVKQRWNTQQVIKHCKPARVYRYQSSTKAKIQKPLACSLNMKNGGGSTRNTSYVFDKIVNVNHNINIYSSCQKEQTRRCTMGNQQENQEKYQGDVGQDEFKENGKEMHSNGKEMQQKLINLNTNQQEIALMPEHQQRIEDISTIQAKKETLELLGESCAAIKEGLSSEKKVNQILDFLGWKTEELKQAFENGKQKKRKYQLDKLSRMFPKGFFP